MTIYDKLMAQADELEVYAKLDGTEVGESCLCLCALAGYPDYLTKVFYEALAQEINIRLTDYKNFTEIAEEEKTETRKITKLVRARRDYE